jgi:hypothetical protein
MMQRLTQTINKAGTLNTLLAQAKQELGILGVCPDKNGRVDLFQLNAALKASGLSPKKRIQVKCLLAEVGCID